MDSQLHDDSSMHRHAFVDFRPDLACYHEGVYPVRDSPLVGPTWASIQHAFAMTHGRSKRRVLGLVPEGWCPLDP